jgi:hypothetical protein
MFWDNTLYARSLESKSYGGYPAHYPGKVRLCNLVEPYDTRRPAGFHRSTGARQIYFNGEAFSEIYKIKYATAADYCWNSEAYQPERSLWKVLCAAYGFEVAEQMLRFNDAYYGLYGACLHLESDGLQNRTLQEGRKHLAKMESCFERLFESLANEGRLLAELKSKMVRQKKRFLDLLTEDTP